MPSMRGTRIQARIPMIRITARSSISVKPPRRAARFTRWSPRTSLLALAVRDLDVLDVERHLPPGLALGEHAQVQVVGRPAETGEGLALYHRQAVEEHADARVGGVADALDAQRHALVEAPLQAGH